MEKAYEYIRDLIKSENENGIPTNRIVIGEILRENFQI